MNILSRIRRLPLTVRVPMTVAILMVAVSGLISERVLDRLSKTQEVYLQRLASAYLDGVVASVTPSVLREDSWEVFDGIERMKPSADDILPLETVVTGKNQIVLASSDPMARETLRSLDPEFIGAFNGTGVRIDANTRSGYVRRDITYQNQLIGAVYAVFDVSSLLRERRQILVTLLATNTVFTAFLGFIGFVTVRRMIRPMQVLETHMIDAAAGSSTLIADSEFPVANKEAVSVYRAYNALVRSEMERQVLARQLAEEEKLASLGRLASGMAHEINNPLGGLMNAVDTLRLHGERRTVRESSIELIQRGLHGIREVVEAALATYRPERLTRPLADQDFADLRLLVRPELRRKQQRLDYQIDGTIDAEPRWPAGPIRQATLNLLLNAAAATPEGGRVGLQVMVTRKELDIAISDQGSGMPDSARSILSDRTNKQVPRDGSGLGLWIVREIAGDLGAAITVSRETGSDTVVRLSVPRTISEVSKVA